MSSTVSLFRIFMLGVLASFVLFSNPSFADDDDEEESDSPAITMTIGTDAPALDIEHWMSDGDGKYEHTTKLDSDKVYVIEFWATWCGPCIASMPHLSETQEKYADQGVQLISVSDEDLETVEEFLEKDVRGKKDKTYAQLTSNYCLTCDPDGSVYEEYFRAAGQNGIPCAFIVGKEGKVEWIGHPMQMDKPLEQVVAGNWDRDAFAVKMKKEQEMAAKMMKMRRKLTAAITKIQTKLEGDEDEVAEALKMFDEMIANEDYESFKPQLESMRLQAVIMHVGGEEGANALNKMVEENEDNPMLLNQIAWTIYERHQESELDEAIIKAATNAAEVAVKADPENGAILDTLAHFVYLNGDLDRALELQEKALEHADGMEGDIKPFLDELKAEKEKKDKEDE